MRIHIVKFFLVCFVCLSAQSQYANATPILEQTSPNLLSYLFDTDFNQMGASPIGDVLAAVTAVDLMLGLGNTTTSGCEAADFTGFVAGNIALMQRGICGFELKALNAQAAGAVGALIFNQGNTPDRLDLFGGTLDSAGDGTLVTIPVFALSYYLGAEFANTPRLTVHMVSEEIDVPVPATLALLGLGLAGLGWLRCKKHA